MCKNYIKFLITITAILSICFSFTTSPFAGPEIFFYDGATITQLTDNDDYDSFPQINNSGEVVWYGKDGNDDEIFYHDGTTITQLTDNDYRDGSPQINDSGEVVWIGYVVYMKGEIFFYDGTTITQLTGNYSQGEFPQINNIGEVVWRGSDGNDFEIYFYDGTNIIQLTDNDYSDSSPQLNNSGEVVWQVWISDGDGEGEGGCCPGVDGSGFSLDEGRGFENIGPCLISATAYGFHISKEIWTLAFLFVSVFIVFHKIRAKFKK